MNACFNRKPFVKKLVVQDGWFMDGVTRVPKMVSITNPMSKDCRYQADDHYHDPACTGCIWKTEKEKAK